MIKSLQITQELLKTMGNGPFQYSQLADLSKAHLQPLIFGMIDVNLKMPPIDFMKLGKWVLKNENLEEKWEENGL
jgi:hypothetical protein